jgi:hypothetical protein
MARNKEKFFLCHCEERSDEAISYYKYVEIAALPTVARNDNLLVKIAALPSVARNDIKKLYLAMTNNNEIWDRDTSDRETLDHRTWNCKPKHRETCGGETGKIGCRLLWLGRET